MIKNCFFFLIRQLSTLKAVAFVTYKEWAAYRSHILISLVVGPINFLIQVSIWKAVFSHQPVINGLSLEQMITYYAVVAIIHYLIMDFSDWNLHMLIRTGRFVTYMIRPLSHRFFSFSQKVGHRILGFFWEFIPVYCIFFFIFRITLIPAHIGWTLCSIFLGFLMNFLINYSIGILGFWLIRGEGVRRMIQIVSTLFQGAFIPLVFFPAIIQKVLFFLPFQFATYVPIRVFIGSYELAGITFSIPEIVGLQAVAVIVMLLVTELLWRLGVRTFTGVGT